jgi:hypothetical protein
VRGGEISFYESIKDPEIDRLIPEYALGGAWPCTSMCTQIGFDEFHTAEN